MHHFNNTTYNIIEIHDARDTIRYMRAQHRHYDHNYKRLRIKYWDEDYGINVITALRLRNWIKLR